MSVYDEAATIVDNVAKELGLVIGFKANAVDTSKVNADGSPTRGSRFLLGVFQTQCKKLGVMFRIYSDKFILVEGNAPMKSVMEFKNFLVTRIEEVQNA